MKYRIEFRRSKTSVFGESRSFIKHQGQVLEFQTAEAAHRYRAQLQRTDPPSRHEQYVVVEEPIIMD